MRTEELISHAHLKLPVAIWNDSNRLELVMNNIDYVWYSKVWYELDYTWKSWFTFSFLSLDRNMFKKKLYQCKTNCSSTLVVH